MMNEDQDERIVKSIENIARSFDKIADRIGSIAGHFR